MVYFCAEELRSVCEQSQFTELQRAAGTVLPVLSGSGSHSSPNFLCLSACQLNFVFCVFSLQMSQTTRLSMRKKFWTARRMITSIS
ncbi:hypothetical protein DV515_00008928 [Chloebia gouldiae]|uniref:Uncharacterized protein n=1 Tax=Chloebia gouldiae TaxID=44316 RepID=A0A3L8SED3_CHLGU|nr:hypothetical protein DV515_00008928 [Chloebia gouldiae]